MASIVSNNAGSFALFGISSRYEGVFFKRGTSVFKTIAHFEIPWAVDKSLEAPINDSVNRLFKAARQHYGVVEYFWFANRLPVFFYELSSGSANVVLDCKDDYDNREWGRMYDIFKDGRSLVVRFKKLNDRRESDAFGEYEFYLAFHGSEFDLVEDWFEKKNFFDVRRNSPPSSRYVLRAFKARGGFACAFGSSKWEALKLARDSWKRKDHLEREAQKFSKKCTRKVKAPKGYEDSAKSALFSLVGLSCGQGLFAGFPWFHQRWARDELISCKALLLADQKHLLKSILFHWLRRFEGHKMAGTLTKTIADSGWLFVRAKDAWRTLKKAEKEEFKKAQLGFERDVRESLSGGLVFAGPKQTWMDSLDREGARIEIQALTLAALRGTGLEKELRKEVRSKFWNGRFLKDSPDDPTIRPNVFIAAYVYPELLSKKDWRACFDHILPRLWLDWGGVATVDRSDPLFTGEHTGEDPESYHNGDSWYWVNNLAAIVLSRFGKRKYKKYIDAILNASRKEITKMGAIGHHAEVSSALRQTSSGCLSQAWSAAMYVELVEELFGR